MQLHAASLNHRDVVAIAQALHGLPLEKPVIPTSDGSGIIHATGAKINTFKPGDKVCTHLLPNKPYAEPATLPDILAGLGMVPTAHCVRTEYSMKRLMRMPEGLSFVEASVLPCAGLTAWNALFGLRGLTGVKEGGVVLVQGTGGVSVIAMQVGIFLCPLVYGVLGSLGAHHVVNYKTDPNWGHTAKQLTPDKKGVHVVVDVGGLAMIGQSPKAVRPEGLISATGLLGNSPNAAQNPTLLECLVNSCVARGVVLGTREQFEEMNQFVEEKGVRPVVDEKGI